jgi:hypothetical protein
MAKFIVGLIVGISLGASVSAYGSGTLSGWTDAQNHRWMWLPKK